MRYCFEQGGGGGGLQKKTITKKPQRKQTETIAKTNKQETLKERVHWGSFDGEYS